MRANNCRLFFIYSSFLTLQIIAQSGEDSQFFVFHKRSPAQKIIGKPSGIPFQTDPADQIEGQTAEEKTETEVIDLPEQDLPDGSEDADGGKGKGGKQGAHIVLVVQQDQHDRVADGIQAVARAEQAVDPHGGIVEAQRELFQDERADHDEQESGDQLLVRVEGELLAQHGEHLIFRLFDIPDGTVVVEKAVIVPVQGIEPYFHRGHEIDGGDQDGEKGAQGRNVVHGSPPEQAFHLDLERAEIHDHKVGKQSQVDKDPYKSQQPVFIKPAQEGKAASLASGKIFQKLKLEQNQKMLLRTLVKLGKLGNLFLKIRILKNGGKKLEKFVIN